MVYASPLIAVRSLGRNSANSPAVFIPSKRTTRQPNTGSPSSTVRVTRPPISGASAAGPTIGMPKRCASGAAARS